MSNADTCPCKNFLRPVFGVCACKWNEFASFACGWGSMLSWMIAQIPSVMCIPGSLHCRQLIKNFRRGEASSLALPFLFQWLIGDSCNFIGAVLTKALRTQVRFQISRLNYLS